MVQLSSDSWASTRVKHILESIEEYFILTRNTGNLCGAVYPGKYLFYVDMYQHALACD